MGSKLVRKYIGSLSEAPRELGNEDKQRIGDTLYNIVPLTMAPSLPSCRFYVEIPHGFHALMLNNGKDAGIWGPGLHYCPPWMTVAHLVPWQFVVFDAPVKQCPTMDNVMVSIDVSLVFKILRDEQHARSFCYNLGPDKLDKVLRAFQEEAIRDMARKKKYNDIYLIVGDAADDLMDTSTDEQLNNTKRHMNENLLEYGVEIQSITITNVHLPADISETMEKETTYESLSLKAQRQQQYELLVLEDREKLHKRRQRVTEDIAEVKSTGEKNSASGRSQLKEIEATTTKMIAQLKEKETSMVAHTMAKSDFNVSELNSTTQVEVAKIRSEGNAQADQILAEAEAYVSNTRAATRKLMAENEAQALAARSEAEGFSAEPLKHKRAFEQNLAKLKVLRAIANNKNLTLAGDNGDNVLAQLLAATKNATLVGLAQTGEA